MLIRGLASSSTRSPANIDNLMLAAASTGHSSDPYTAWSVVVDRSTTVRNSWAHPNTHPGEGRQLHLKGLQVIMKRIGGTSGRCCPCLPFMKQHVDWRRTGAPSNSVPVGHVQKAGQDMIEQLIFVWWHKKANIHWNYLQQQGLLYDQPKQCEQGQINANHAPLRQTCNAWSSKRGNLMTPGNQTMVFLDIVGTSHAEVTTLFWYRDGCTQKCFHTKCFLKLLDVGRS